MKPLTDEKVVEILLKAKKMVELSDYLNHWALESILMQLKFIESYYEKNKTLKKLPNKRLVLGLTAIRGGLEQSHPELADLLFQLSDAVESDVQKKGI